MSFGKIMTTLSKCTETNVWCRCLEVDLTCVLSAVILQRSWCYAICQNAAVQSQHLRDATQPGACSAEPALLRSRSGGVLFRSISLHVNSYATHMVERKFCHRAIATGTLSQGRFLPRRLLMPGDGIDTTKTIVSMPVIDPENSVPVIRVF